MTQNMIQCADLKQEYQKLRPIYEKFTQKLHTLLEEISESKGVKAVIESQTKEIESFHEKASRPGKSYVDPIKEITDLSGIRIILYSLSDIEAVSEVIESEFQVDYNKSINKLEQFEPDRFGYLSQHFIVKVSASRSCLPEWKEVCDLWAEIQVRTVLQHAWASVEHFLLYKNEADVPTPLRRRLFRLSALFELADEELDHLIKDINEGIAQYKMKFTEGNNKIEVNIDSLKAYIQSAAEPKYWIQFLRDNTHQRIDENDWGILPSDIGFCQYFGIDSIEAIDDLLKNAHGWGELFFLNYYEKFFQRHNITSDKVSTVIDGPIIMLMIASNIDKITSDILANTFAWWDGQMLIDSAREARGMKMQ